MSYNLTGLENATDVIGVIQFADAASGEWLIFSFMIAFSIIMLMVLKKYDFLKAFTVMSWTSLLLSGMLWGAGLINPLVPLLYVAMTAFSIFALHID